MAVEELIRLESVSFAYGGRSPLFREINMVVRAGDRLGLVGPNGSGKTSLMHLIVGLLAPAAGRVRALGLELAGEVNLRKVRRRVGLLFQDADDQLFNPTVGEDVAFGPLNLGLDHDAVGEAVDRALSAVGMAGFGERLSHDLSGGEKRLAALATVLAMDPEVLLLDEPSAGLDPRARRELVALLGRIERTQVVSSHDMEFVRATCDRVVLLDGGSIIADGRTDEVLGDSELMLEHGLEVPYSIDAGVHGPHDHHHGAGVGHGHGHRRGHDTGEHAAVK